MISREPCIRFVKATACGNDFLVVEKVDSSSDLKDLSVRMCNRHSGIGADGVEWLSPDPEADVAARLFNADGSEAEISGNGTRCVAAYLCSIKDSKEVVIRTGAGLKTCTLISHSGSQYEFETAMGEPRIEKELLLPLESGPVKGIPVSIGNPHYVVFVEKFHPFWQAGAAEIGRHPDFEQGINVEFVVVKDKSNIDAKFFERGVGETQSSGTGSCAAAVVSIGTGRAISPLRVHAAGGTQMVRWETEVFLQGPAQLIGGGEFFA